MGARSSAPEIRIGLLNMMPDAALAAAELQFMRLIGRSTLNARFFTHVFSLPYLRRSPAARAYIERHYTTFAEVRKTGLDALIITGANVSNPTLEIEPFWRPLQEVIDWAADAVSSTLCSCLATHALLKHLHGIDRHRLPRKLWGVYSHRARDRRHPLLQGIESDFPVPHSRFNDVRADEIEAAGLSVLADSETAGVHLAVSADQRGIVFFQGHPEYQAITLLKGVQAGGVALSKPGDRYATAFSRGLLFSPRPALVETPCRAGSRSQGRGRADSALPRG